MNNNRCVCCGTEIPEGRQVCWACEHECKPQNQEEIEEIKNEKN
jgi:hypothetical protein